MSVHVWCVCSLLGARCSMCVLSFSYSVNIKFAFAHMKLYQKLHMSARVGEKRDDNGAMQTQQCDIMEKKKKNESKTIVLNGNWWRTHTHLRGQTDRQSHKRRLYSTYYSYIRGDGSMDSRLMHLPLCRINLIRSFSLSLSRPFARSLSHSLFIEIVQ